MEDLFPAVDPHVIRLHGNNVTAEYDVFESKDMKCMAKVLGVVMKTKITSALVLFIPTFWSLVKGCFSIRERKAYRFLERF